MNLIKLISVCSRLSSLHRFSMERLSAPESVLEHTAMVAIMSMAIACEVNRLDTVGIDVGAVVIRALVHDMDELITGDLPRPTKYSSPKATELFEELARTGITKVTATMLKDWPGFGSEVAAVHATAKQGREGSIIKLADQLAVVAMVWREVIMRGNMTMVRQAFTVSQQLEGTRRLISSLFVGDSRLFLDDLIMEAMTIASMAKAKNESIHGIMQEDT